MAPAHKMSWILEELGFTQDSRKSEVALDAALAHIHSEGSRVKPKKLRTQIPAKALEPISQGTYTMRGRQQIMEHIQKCLQKPLENSNWRQIYVALVITRQAMLNGEPLLFEEIAEGRHFNPLQQISLLTHYKMDGIGIESEHLICSKASALHDELLPPIQAAIEARIALKASMKQHPKTKAPVTTDVSPHADAGLLGAILQEVGFTQEPEQLTQSEVELAEALAYIPTIDIQPKRLRTLIPQKSLQIISKGTHTDKGRLLIMQHLRKFLRSDISDWRPVHAAIVIASEAILNGSPTLLQDIAEGRHFDPMQRLVMLEKYESGEDDGNAHAATNLINQKAHALCNELNVRLQGLQAPAVAPIVPQKEEQSDVQMQISMEQPQEHSGANEVSAEGLTKPQPEDYSEEKLEADGI